MFSKNECRQKTTHIGKTPLDHKTPFDNTY